MHSYNFENCRYTGGNTLPKKGNDFYFEVGNPATTEVFAAIPVLAPPLYRARAARAGEREADRNGGGAKASSMKC